MSLAVVARTYGQNISCCILARKRTFRAERKVVMETDGLLWFNLYTSHFRMTLCAQREVIIETEGLTWRRRAAKREVTL